MKSSLRLSSVSKVSLEIASILAVPPGDFFSLQYQSLLDHARSSFPKQYECKLKQGHKDKDQGCQDVD